MRVPVVVWLRPSGGVLASWQEEAGQALGEHRDGREAVLRGGMFVCQFLERMRLGTPYPDVAKRLTRLYDNLAIVAQKRLQAWAMDTLNHGLDMVAPMDIKIFVDATGVGQPVVDMLTAAGVKATPVYFTHGDRRSISPKGVTLGKAWMVSKLQTLLQSRRLMLLDLEPGQQGYEESVAVRDELLNYEIRVSEKANDQYGAFRVGKFDDLVTALGLATQEEWQSSEVPPDFMDFVMAQL